MPGNAVSLRERRLFYLVHEQAHVSFELLNAGAQFAACFGFYTWAKPDFYVAACWIFFVTSINSIGLTLNSIVEVLRSQKDASPDEHGVHEREIYMDTLYIIGGTIYAVGSILFLPDVYKGSKEQEILSAGTSLFVAGSLFFALAVFTNALTVSVHSIWFVLPFKSKLSLATIACNGAGSTLYAMGSVLFYPKLEDATCESGPAPENSWSTLDLGTHYFVAGGSCFLAGAILNWLLSLLKHFGADRHKETHELIHPGKTRKNERAGTELQSSQI
uniref:YrhK domain-containing protein n=1 Tax=Chrysotila carterae TaxID=13221 RepID=A0A7S4C0M6_CHRCT|mmetsp:Transcript_30353/g.66571  ORF Transcript_30353/g.66571 Transcript_30353/m.66571 type:complete len:274 (-) Transcript_30353:606-1427(-)|eukprot:6194627-Pleurochrysis_carterae.AAC.2